MYFDFKVFDAAVVGVKKDYTQLIADLRNDLHRTCGVTIHVTRDGGYRLLGNPQQLVKAEEYIIANLENIQKLEPLTNKHDSASMHSQRTIYGNDLDADSGILSLPLTLTSQEKESKQVEWMKPEPDMSGTSPRETSSKHLNSDSGIASLPITSTSRESSEPSWLMNPKRPKTATVPPEDRLYVDSSIWKYITKLHGDYIHSIKTEFGVHIIDRKQNNSGMVSLDVISKGDAGPAKEKLSQLISTYQSSLVVEKFVINPDSNTNYMMLNKKLKELQKNQTKYIFQRIGDVLYILGPRKSLPGLKAELHICFQAATPGTPVYQAMRKQPLPTPNTIFTTTATFETLDKRRIHLYCGDITTIPTEAIVNSANRRLEHDTGIAKSISQAAGPELQRHCCELVSKHGPLDVTHSTVTPGYQLPSGSVVHVVGPKWSDFRLSEKEECVRLLHTSLVNCLQAADRVKCTSVAIPAISAGKSQPYLYSHIIATLICISQV